VVVQNINLQILVGLLVISTHEYEKVVFGIPSVSLCLLVSMNVCVPSWHLNIQRHCIHAQASVQLRSVSSACKNSSFNTGGP
jgi:hypothetical protein